MCKLLKVNLDIEELIIENSESENSQSNFILKEVKAEIDSISELFLMQRVSNRAIIKYDEDDDETIKTIPIYDCKSIVKLNMLYYPCNIIFKGTLKNLSAKYTICNTKFTLSCDNLKVDNVEMKNTKFIFKKKSNAPKDEKEWYNLIFLLLANEI